MLRYDHNTDLGRAFAEQWNQRLRSVRIASFIVSILMLVFGVLCVVYPIVSVRVLSILAAVCIAAFGVFEIVEYCSLPLFLRTGGTMAAGVLNILFGVLLLSSPADVTVSTFSFLFALMLMLFGIEEIVMSSKLRYFGVSDYAWVVVSGVLNLIASAVFLILPMASAVFLNYVIAIYLLVGGATLLIEAFSMNDLKVD